MLSLIFAVLASFHVQAISSQDFLSKKMQRLEQWQQGRAQMAHLNDLRLSIKGNKADFLRAIYQYRIVDSSPYSMLWSDKLLALRELKRWSKTPELFPKVIGIKEFLETRALLSSRGEVVRDGDRIEAELAREFAYGFWVRPTVGVTKDESGSGIFREPEELVADLLSPTSRSYRTSFYGRPVASQLLGAVASGEPVILIENVVMRERTRKKKNLAYEWVRIHSYGSRVVEEAKSVRWFEGQAAAEWAHSHASYNAKRLLTSLPDWLIARQAWGLDFLVLQDGTCFLMNVSTNRGKELAWSSYLDQPQVLGAYVNFFESNFDIKFTGVGAWMLRKGYGNLPSYWSRIGENNSKISLFRQAAFFFGI